MSIGVVFRCVWFVDVKHDEVISVIISDVDTSQSQFVLKWMPTHSLNGKLNIDWGQSCLTHQHITNEDLSFSLA